jgi:hypothetical protein
MFETRLEIHYTPKHRSWLNSAEIELNVLARQCLSDRIAAKPEMKNTRRRVAGRTEPIQDAHRLAIHAR